MKKVIERYAENISINSDGLYVLQFQGASMYETLYFAFERDLIFHLENYGLRSI